MSRSVKPGAAGPPRARRGRRAYAIGVGVGLVPILGVCLLLWPDGSPGGPGGRAPAAECDTTITVMSSTEKAKLLTGLAEAFERTSCNHVKIDARASGDLLTALADGLRASPGTTAKDLPEVWSPASSVWYRLLEQRTGRSERELFTRIRGGITQTPLVIALPKPIADELAKEGPLTWGRILRLADDPAAWQKVSKGRWGPFTLGKTDPNLSTAGLTSLLTEYAALSTGNPGAVSEADTRDGALQEKLSRLELATIHYGETTLDYLCKLAAADEVSAAKALSYVSAVPVEEKSVFDHNSGRRDWCPHKNQARVPLVPVAPADGTIMSDSPYAVLADATPAQVALADQFFTWLGEREQQQRFTGAGFRGLDGNLDEAVAGRLGVTSKALTTFVPLPDGPVIDAVLASWEKIRKPARLLLVVDTSLSMGYGMTTEVEARTGEDSRLDRVKDALTQALDDVGGRDEVGLWTFSGDSSSAELPYRKVVAPGPIGATKAALTRGIDQMRPGGATALYVTTAAAHDWLDATTTGGSSIRAVIVLTDGADAYQKGAYKKSRLMQAIDASGAKDPVRVFTIAYGADTEMLEQLDTIASVSGGRSYPVQDRSMIRAVLREVISNF